MLQKAMKWWNNLSSLQKTQLCDTNTELVGSVRRWETLTGREIRSLFKRVLIQSVGFEKDWNKLSWDQKTDFMTLIGLLFLDEHTERIAIKTYDEYRTIVDHRSLDKLYLYLD